tara:strand:+ start:139 stop:483 length:345 start_codon:yes stop_codon:yes gene_type:complete
MKKVIYIRDAAVDDYVFMPADSFIAISQVSATKGYLTFSPTLTYEVDEATVITFNFTDDSSGDNTNFKNIAKALADAIAFGNEAVIVFADSFGSEGYLHPALVATALDIDEDLA